VLPLFFLINNDMSEYGKGSAMSKISDFVWGLAEPVAEKHGCVIWDVEFVREAGQQYLRVYIDKDEPVSVEDCEKISRELGDILDEKDPIPDNYIFEVGSAGAERVLKRDSDFEKFLHSNVEVRLYNSVDGTKLFVGELLEYGADGSVEIGTESGTLRFEKPQVAQVKLRIN